MNRRTLLKSGVGGVIAALTFNKVAANQAPQRNDYDDTAYVQWHVDNARILPQATYTIRGTVDIGRGTTKIDGSTFMVPEDSYGDCVFYADPRTQTWCLGGVPQKDEGYMTNCVVRSSGKGSVFRFECASVV